MQTQNQADAFGIEKTELRRDNALGEYILFIVLNIIIFIMLLYVYISHLSKQIYMLFQYLLCFNIRCESQRTPQACFTAFYYLAL